MQSQARSLVASIILAAVTFALYAQVSTHGFILYDDDKYIINNPLVNQGVSLEALYRVFTQTHLSNWHPITTATQMLDVELFGMDLGKHHLVNLFLHIINTLLIFAFLRTVTGKFWPSWLVALLFAIHPAHVESVAWLSERKDVLSTMFFMLTLWFYYSYTRTKNRASFVLSIISLALGLMSKPMLVTTPFVLVLLDIWPLKRFSVEEMKIHELYKLLIEKWPYFILIVISAILTYMIQSESGAMSSGQLIGLAGKVENALISYVRYLWMALYPAKLTIFYPHPSDWPTWSVIFSTVLLVLITITAVVKLKKYPWFFVGWFFFLGTLVPVIGVVQVGAQSIADRYTYIPYIGLFVIFSWGIEELKKHIASLKFVLNVTVILWSGLLFIIAFNYISLWKNDVSLFKRVLEVHDPGYHEVLKNNGRQSQAREVYTGLSGIYHNVGIAYYQAAMLPDAKIHFFEAIRINPNLHNAYYYLGKVLLREKRYKLAYGFIHTAKEMDSERQDEYTQVLEDIESLMTENSRN